MTVLILGLFVCISQLNNAHNYIVMNDHKHTTVLVLSVYCTDVEQTSLNLCMLYIIFICIKKHPV